MYPDYCSIDWNSYDRIDGMHSLGFIHRHRPDIAIITDQTECDFDPDIIIPQIEQALGSGRKAALFFWDEDFIMPNHHSYCLNRELEQFQNQSVFLCSNMMDDQLKIYTHQKGIPIKVKHIPWWYINTIPGMLAKKTSVYPGPGPGIGYNWACLINRPNEHKTDLINGLKSRGLEGLNHQTRSTTHYYQPGDQAGWRSSHDMKRSLVWDVALNRWIDHLARNIYRLEQILGDCPMIINPESTVGIFPMTEKSFWPVVLDRMFVIYARPGIMRDIQSFLTYDLAIYLDLEFDTIEGYEPRDHRLRLECLLDKNHYTLSHARDIYPIIGDQIRTASKNIATICYQKFCKSLDAII